MSRAKLVSLFLAVMWVWNSLLAAGGGLGPEPALAQAPAASQNPEQAWSLAVARDERDTLWAAWEVDDGHDSEIYAAQWNGQQWSEAAPVTSRPEAWDRAPSLAVAADGTPWVAWSSTLRSSPEKARIYASRWTGDGWSSAEVLPEGDAFGGCSSCGWATEPALAAAADGTLWLAWVGSDAQESNVFAQRWNGGVWSLPRQVSDGEGSASLYDRQPQVAVGKDGRPWIAWAGNQAGSDGVPIPGDDEIYASRWTGAEWTPEEMVSRDDESLDTWPALALDGQGQPWIAWQARVTEDEDSHLRILTSRWDAARQAWTLESIASSPPAAEIEEVHPTLAADSRGAMQVAWTGRAAGNVVLGYARRTGSGWSAPLLVASGPESGVSAEGEAKLVAGATGPALLWLDPLPQEVLPVERFEVPLEEDNSLATWLAAPAQAAEARAVTSDPYPYRFLAFGDSITWGGYPVDNPDQPPFYPYPSILQDRLQVTADPRYNVINEGEPGEGTGMGANRIKLVVNEWRPQYVLIMEGTNDVSRDIPPSETYDNLLLMLANATKHSGVVGVKAMLATIIPRLDGADRLEQTRLLNELAIIAVAEYKGVPLADQWQAFMDYGDWPSLMWDDKHPDQAGLQLISDTFYARIVERWVILPEDTTPPTAWIEPMPASSPCGGVGVAWNGTDDMSGIVAYDVQVQVNLGTWTDWLLSTTWLSAFYTAGSWGDQLGFRVRARDQAGNVSDFSTPAYTTIVDDQAPEAQMLSLPQVQAVPFAVSWQGSDNCSSIAVYHVQVRAGASLTWTDWLLATPDTSAAFNPPAPDFGERVYFRVQARDQAGNWSTWSAEVSTLAARYTLGGQVLNIRHEPVAVATKSTSPAALGIVSQAGGRFLAFLEDGGTYQVTAQRDQTFGSLPPMNNVAVAGNVSGLVFVLPPKDDAVQNGGFEAGLAGWTQGGASAPSATAHTGLGAARLDGSGGSASLVQVVTPAAGMTQAYLSIMARLAAPGEASTLQIRLSKEGSPDPPEIHEVSLTSDTWTHAWFALGNLQGEPLTVALIVSGTPAILVDEVSLGTAQPGGNWIYLPLSWY